jgi:hypothetical protein
MKNSVFRGTTHRPPSRGKASWDEPNQREFS